VKEAPNLRPRSVHVETAAGPAFSIERREDLDLFDLGTRTPHPATAVVGLEAVQHAHLRGGRAGRGTYVFARLLGVPAAEVALDGNDFRLAKTPTVVAGNR
jgi:hypothetical protein